MNLEMYLFLFILGFIFFYLKKKYFIAILFLSFAICMKLYPILFLLFFLQDKKFKYIMISFIMCLVFTISSLAIFRGGILDNINSLLINLNLFNSLYSSSSGLQHNSSLYGVFKIFLIKLVTIIYNYNIKDANIFINSLLRVPYLIFVALYFTIITSYIHFIEKTLWKKVFLIISMTLLLPHVSFDYKLLHIIIAIILFVDNVNNERYSILYSILFALLIVPNSYFYIANDISIGVIINPIIMLLITFKIFYENKNLIKNRISILINKLSINKTNQ
jgi:hypothetical protein